MKRFMSMVARQQPKARGPARVLPRAGPGLPLPDAPGTPTGRVIGPPARWIGARSFGVR